MRNIVSNILTVKGNQAINLGKSGGKQKEMNLAQLPIILKRSILDWEDRMRQEIGDKYFDSYEELSSLTGIAVSTLRKYITTTEASAEYPPINKLIQICLIICDKKPLEFIIDYADKVIK